MPATSRRATPSASAAAARAPDAEGGPRREGRIVKVYPELDGGRVIADAEVDGLGDFFVGERVPVWITVARAQGADRARRPRSSTRNGVDYVRVAGEGGPLDVPVVSAAAARRPRSRSCPACAPATAW